MDARPRRPSSSPARAAASAPRSRASRAPQATASSSLPRRQRELEEVARGSGQDALPVVADVTRRSEVESALRRALEPLRARGRVDQQRGPRDHTAGGPALGRRLRRDDADEREVGALRHAGGAAALPRARPGAHRQPVVDARPRAVRDAALGLLRSEARAQRAHRLSAHGSRAIAPRHPCLDAVAGRRRHRVRRARARRRTRLPAEAGRAVRGEVAQVLLDLVHEPRADVYSRPGMRERIASYYAAEDMAEVEATFMPLPAR